MNIDLDSLTPEQAFYLEYYGINKMAKEEHERFEKLGKMFGGKK